MLEIVRRVDAGNFQSDELWDWLDVQYNTKSFLENSRMTNLDAIAEYQNWGLAVLDNCPDDLASAFFYITDASSRYPQVNLQGRLNWGLIWPKFFDLFPLANIWFCRYDDRWDDLYASGVKQMFADAGGKLSPLDPPLGMTGLTSFEFPFIALSFLSSCVYPLVLMDIGAGPSGTVVVYIPDRAFSHSQIGSTPSIHQKIMRKVHHIFDDEWTVTSTRGPKQRADHRVLNPILCADFLEWFILTIGKRMVDLSEIPDVYLREKTGMTINRAMIDSQLSTVSELPYLSKSMFFSCLDKVANFKVEGDRSVETSAWKELLDSSYLAAVNERLEEVPTDIGGYIRLLVERTDAYLTGEGISPTEMRTIRNSLHGYFLTKPQFDDLAKTSGTFNNNVTLVTTPLVLDVLASSWK